NYMLQRYHQERYRATLINPNLQTLMLHGHDKKAMFASSSHVTRQKEGNLLEIFVYVDIALFYYSLHATAASTSMGGNILGKILEFGICDIMHAAKHKPDSVGFVIVNQGILSTGSTIYINFLNLQGQLMEIFSIYRNSKKDDNLCWKKTPYKAFEMRSFLYFNLICIITHAILCCYYLLEEKGKCVHGYVGGMAMEHALLFPIPSIYQNETFQVCIDMHLHSLLCHAECPGIDVGL
ncbi:hypothetical protein ACJX0J_013140, partial [Zea mays]